MNDNLRADYDRYMLPVYAPPLPVMVRGQGARLWDNDGREYVDFGGGIAVVALGHSPPLLASALYEQAQKLMHTSNLYANEAAILLARMLVDNTFAERVFLCNSGAEANEAALKLARARGILQHRDKYRILAFENGFHGRIGFGLAATKKARRGFGPLAAGFDFASFNHISAATKKVNDKTCAIIVEPVQGEGGVHPASVEFLGQLRALADKFDALLIFDEIQTGVGRCGDLYAYMSAAVIPDILTSAKGLGGGFPIGAMLCGRRAATVLSAGAHGSTFGGNPLAARAAATILSEVLSPGFLAKVQERAADLRRYLQEINRRLNCFVEIRGRGLLIGAQMKPGADVQKAAAAALDNGVIVLTAAGNVMRFAPALNISAADMQEGFARLEKSLRG